MGFETHSLPTSPEDEVLVPA